MKKVIKTSHEAYLKSSFETWRYLSCYTIIVVFIASIFRGSDFELINIIKSVTFILISLGILCYGVIYWATWKSIKLGELEDNGILFRKPPEI